MCSTSNHDHSPCGHGHGSGVGLDEPVADILRRGLGELLDKTQGLAFKPFGSDRFPLPLVAAVYGGAVEPEAVRQEVSAWLGRDPIAALDGGLVLLELMQSSDPAMAKALPHDAAFLSECFGSKRLNGWIAMLGDGDRAAIEAAVNARWQFKFMPGEGLAGLYILLNMLARYGFVYGRIPFGDSHALGHFIEEFTPGLVLCAGELSGIELALSLAAMKLGVPAVVPSTYPFPLGRMARVDSLSAISEAVVAFPNIRRLLDMPGVPPLPDWLDRANARQEFVPAGRLGDTSDSLYILRGGRVDQPGVEVVGQPGPALGVILTVEGEPLDGFDRRYIEERAAAALCMIHGVRARCDDGRLMVEVAAGVDLPGEQIGRTLAAAISHEFPRLRKVDARIIFDRQELARLAVGVQAELEKRQQEIASASDDNVSEVITCIGCSPFAPDHVCILTPDRPPQCGRPYEMIKTGALYGYDDMSNIHHRAPHSGLNSFGMCRKGRALNRASGEWSGINEAVSRLTGGRTRRVQLHSLAEAPHTGCGCFRLVMFRMEGPRPGIGIMDRSFRGPCPDGRTWADLHYALAGKQTVGIAGASPGYLRSPKFLAGDGGWSSVVWVSPKVADWMGDALPGHVEVGQET